MVPNSFKTCICMRSALSKIPTGVPWPCALGMCIDNAGDAPSVLVPHCTCHVQWSLLPQSVIPAKASHKSSLLLLWWGQALCKKVGWELTSMAASGAASWGGEEWLLKVNDFIRELLHERCNCNLPWTFCFAWQTEESNCKVFRYQHESTLDLNDLQMELLKPKGML